MIISKLTGGLGNQMFQYAVGRRAAFVNKAVFKLDILGYQHQENITSRKYELHIFNLEANFADRDEINKIKQTIPLLSRLLPFYRQSYIKERHYHFDQYLLQIKDNIYLEGYWQSEKYFKDIERIIREEFIFRDKPKKINKRVITQMQKSDSVSIHVRRGDYVTDKRTNKYHGFCDLDYYQKAVGIITKKIKTPRFFIFSDDPVWVKANFKINYHVDFIDWNTKDDSFEDMRLMSLCKHNIIANSTFSWWGAWLNKNNKKIVIVPKKWFAHESINTNDLIPEGWIKV